MATTSQMSSSQERVLRSSELLELLQGIFPEQLVVSSISVDVVGDKGEVYLIVNPLNREITVLDSFYSQRAKAIRLKIERTFGQLYEVD